jgi:hypothetical protein
MKLRNFLIVCVVTAVLLLVPVIGMQVSDDVNWTIGDFIFAGLLIFVTGILLALAFEKFRPPMRYVFAVLIVCAFAAIWVDGAVGIFD